MYLHYQHEVGGVQSITNNFRQYVEVFGTICDSDTVSSKSKDHHMVSVSKYCTFCKLCRNKFQEEKWTQNMNGTLNCLPKQKLIKN